VVEFLRSQGVNPSLLSAQGFGATDSVAPNIEPVGRIEVTLIGLGNWHGFGTNPAMKTTPNSGTISKGVCGMTFRPRSSRRCSKLAAGLLSIALPSLAAVPLAATPALAQASAEGGVDIGYLKGGVLVWAVFAPTTDLKPGALTGDFGGVTAGASAGVGGSANVLIGGSTKSISLQPLSVEGDKGINVATGIAAYR
jgi:hypothetical protein